MIVYWLVLAKVDFRELELHNHNLDYKNYLWWNKVLCHSTPFLSSLINVIISRLVFVPGHLLYMFVIGVFYLITNYYGTLGWGKPIYFFLTWEDYTSVIIGMGIYLAAAIV